MQKIISRLGSHIVEGVEYPNLPSIAKEYGMTLNCVYKRYSRGCRGDNLVPEKKRKNYVKPIIKPKYRYIVNGVGYKSKRQACKINNIKEITVRKRMDRGWSFEEALTTPTRFHYVPNDDLGSGTAKSITVEGKEFRTISEAAREYGLIPENVQAALQKGFTIEQALKLEIRPTLDSFYFEGQFYRNRKHLSRKFNFPPSLLRNRLNRGLTIREALNLGNKNIGNEGRYNEEVFKRNPDLANKSGKLYFASVLINNKKRYKIGITAKNIIDRLAKEFVIYKLIKCVKKPLYHCYLLEKRLLNNFSIYRDRKIKPDQLDGYKEVFDFPNKVVENITKILEN